MRSIWHTPKDWLKKMKSIPCGSIIHSNSGSESFVVCYFASNNRNLAKREPCLFDQLQEHTVSWVVQPVITTHETERPIPWVFVIFFRIVFYKNGSTQNRFIKWNMRRISYRENCTCPEARSHMAFVYLLNILSNSFSICTHWF